MDSRLNLIFSRRSVRTFKPDKIERNVLGALLEAVMAAPTAMGRGPWHFIVIEDSAVLKQIAEILPNGAFIKNAAAGIIVAGDLERAHMNSLSYLLQDSAAAIENLLLAATALEIGCCWIGVHPREERVNGIRNYFNLPSAIVPVAAIALGYQDEMPKNTIKMKPENIHWGKW